MRDVRWGCFAGGGTGGREEEGMRESHLREEMSEGAASATKCLRGEKRARAASGASRRQRCGIGGSRFRAPATRQRRSIDDPCAGVGAGVTSLLEECADLRGLQPLIPFEQESDHAADHRRRDGSAGHVVVAAARGQRQNFATRRCAEEVAQLGRDWQPG